MFAVSLIIVGLLLIFAPIGASAMTGAHNILGTLICMISGLALALVGLVVAVWQAWYRRTSADQAFVRTGKGGSRVVLDGGTLVVPMFHRVIEINLKTMKLGVNPRGANALITRDNLRANVLAQFYIRVAADEEHILNAARSLGENSVNAEAVEALVSEKLVSALRAIASQMDLFEIHTKRDEFAEKVKEHVKSDLEANGLLLESVTISELDQTDPSELSDNNVFDAQGKRKITEITAAAAIERNNLERDAERARKIKDVDTRQQVLALERQQAEAEASQATEIAKVRADKEREAQEAVITQQRQVELAKIEKERQVQAQEIAREQAIEVARTQQEQAVQAAQVQRDGAIQMANVEREKSVAVADRQREIALAEQEMARAKAEEAALNASAEREKAGQQVTTVTQLAEADREASKKIIAAKQEIEQGRLRQQTAADIEAYTKVKQAEAEREAATKQAEAKLQLAQAESASMEQISKGQNALQMVAVNVAREQVNVEQAKVAVERQQLENRQEFAEAGIQLEIQRLTIQAGRDVQMEFARSLAAFLSNGHMTLYGTPETATTMLDNMSKGFAARSLVDGFISGPASNGSSGDGLSTLLSGMGSILQPMIDKASGGTKLSPDAAADLARNLANNPVFLAVLNEAVQKAPSESPATAAPAAEPKAAAADGASAKRK